MCHTWRDKVPSELIPTATWAYVASATGWTPEQWGALSVTEQALFLRALEARDAELAETVRDTVTNALANGFQKKGKPVIDLYAKVETKKKRLDHAEALSKMNSIQNKLDREEV